MVCKTHPKESDDLPIQTKITLSLEIQSRKTNGVFSLSGKIHLGYTGTFAYPPTEPCATNRRFLMTEAPRHAAVSQWDKHRTRTRGNRYIQAEDSIPGGSDFLRKIISLGHLTLNL